MSSRRRPRRACEPPARRRATPWLWSTERIFDFGLSAFTIVIVLRGYSRGSPPSLAAVGTELARRMVERAWGNGFTLLTATTLRENRLARATATPPVPRPREPRQRDRA